MRFFGVERTEVGKETVCVTVEIREQAVVRRVRITAGSIERALSMAGQGRPERKVRLIVPVDAERFTTKEAKSMPKGILSCAAFAEVA